MELNPDYIKEKLSEIGKKEGLNLLKELINNSNDSNIRKKALENFGMIEENNNFSFFEHLFLSDEDLDIRLIAAKILKDKYLTHKKLFRLLEYTLKKVDSVDQKVFAVGALNSMESPKARKILTDYLKDFIKIKFKDKIPVLDFSYDYKLPIPESVIEILINLILCDFYEDKCRYLVTLRKGKIVALNCESSNLEEISNIYGFYLLNDLEHLSIQRNNFKRISHIQHLSKLKTLDLSHNKLGKIENLESLEKLEDLYLSDNNIKRIDNLESLSKLKKLILSNNAIKVIENLNSLKNLEVLDLSHNDITYLRDLDKLENLKRLNLSSNKIEKMEGLSQLTNLMWLYLNDNRISQLESLSTLDKLKGLYLSNNTIERIQSLENLISLKKLELSGNRIQRLEGLNKLGELQELYLDNNLIQKIEGLEGLNHLIMLHIGRNRIVEFKKESVDHLKNLNFIFLNENPLNQKSFVEYQKKIRFP
ncbi:MAG: leucine-rich repeat protein [Candidatus Thorarchaeota archaeon]